jgi:hypothetical protein
MITVVRPPFQATGRGGLMLKIWVLSADDHVRAPFAGSAPTKKALEPLVGPKALVVRLQEFGV